MNSVLEKEFNVIKDLYKSCEKEASEVILFGSVVEGTWNENSDIDVLFVAKKDKVTELDKSVRKACASRNLRIGDDVCIEDLQGYGGKSGFFQRSYLHLLKIDECDLKAIGPIGHSVKRGKNITELLYGNFPLRQV
ncbi:nucleotidyltransferase domain-containing protein [bacterium]|nr:nucleotidyltransferase domain-containing protein [bacterium]